MTKSHVAVVFLRGWSRYNAGEIAGFAPDQAESLIADGIAEKAPEQPEDAARVTVSFDIDPRETEAFKEARAEIELAAQDALDRAAALDAREAELARREAELLVKPHQDADGEAVAQPAASATAGLPKQGR